MLGKLVWFVVITRVSKVGLAILVSLTAVMVALGVLGALQGSSTAYQVQQSARVYAVGYLTFAYALLASVAGFVVLKADLDYLFTLPLDRKTLGTALYLANLVLYSLLIAYMTSFSFSAGLSVISPILGLSLASLSVVLAGMKLWVRGLVVAGVVAWFLSALLGFPYSPASIAYGHVGESLGVTLGYTAVLTYLAVRRLGHYDQLLMRTLSRSSGEVKDVLTFSPSSPLTTFLKLKLAYLALTGRFGFYSGSGEYRSATVKISTAVLFSSALAVVYSAIVFALKGSGEQLTEAVVMSAHIYVLAVTALSLTMSGLMVERAWLLFPTFGHKFLRYVALGTALQALVLASPFAVADLVLSTLLGPSTQLGSLLLKGAISNAALTPLVTALSLYVLAVTLPVQLRDEVNPVNIEVGGRSFLFGMWFMIPTVAAIAVLLGPLYVSAIVTAVTAVLVAVVLSDRMVAKAVKDMVERGYV